MPCYEVRLTTVEFKAKYAAVLEEAMSRLGIRFQKYEWGYQTYQMKIDLVKEKVTMPEGSQDILNALKREYSKVCLEAIAKQKRWRLKQTAANNFQAVRL
jgi:hypothetical protein